MQWNRKSVMRAVTVFKKFLLPFILWIDVMNYLGITYLSRTKSFIVQDELDLVNFLKADIRVISTLKIPAHTGWPVKLDTTLESNQEPMPFGIQADLTIASRENLCLFSEPAWWAQTIKDTSW
jgi:hypothetical protein